MKYRSLTDEETADLNARFDAHEALMAAILTDLAEQSGCLEVVLHRFDASAESIRKKLPFEGAYHAEQAAHRIRNLAVAASPPKK